MFWFSTWIFYGFEVLMLWYGSDYAARSFGVLDVVILCCIFLRYGMSLENWVLGDVWLLISCALCLWEL